MPLLCASTQQNSRDLTDLTGLRSLLTEAVELMSDDPKSALSEGRWVKLICGASYQDLPRVKALCFAYTLAGVDCIDMSASQAVVTAAEEGVGAAMLLAEQVLGKALPRRPWLMVSINDQQDLHFRKAAFDATRCPHDCPRPCESICPTQAIPPLDKVETPLPSARGRREGVASPERCYGCGRCVSVCPLGLIEAVPYQVEAADVLTSLAGRIDALEIHTNASASSVGRDPFEDLCRRIRPQASGLRAVSVSFPFMGTAGTAAFLKSRNAVFGRCFGRDDERPFTGVLAGVGDSPPPRPLHIWQTDGRPMSGDIGRGTTLSAVKFAQVVLRSQALPWASSMVSEDEHFLQLAGGTNAYTAEKLADEGLLSPASVVRGQSDATQEKDRSAWVHGLAFGGFARMEVDRIMSQWGLGPEASLIEAPPDALLAVLRAAFGVVRPIKKR